MNCVGCDICVYHLGLCVFFPGVFLSSRVIGACPVTTDLIMRVNVRTTYYCCAAVTPQHPRQHAPPPPPGTPLGHISESTFSETTHEKKNTLRIKETKIVALVRSRQDQDPVDIFP